MLIQMDEEYDDEDNADDDIYIMVKCLSVTFLLISKSDPQLDC